MNKYESVIIIKPDLDDVQIKEIVDGVKNFINEKGQIDKVEDIGTKKLAYTVRGCEYGHYVIFYYKAEFEFVAKLEDYYKKENNIIKFIVFKNQD